MRYTVNEHNCIKCGTAYRDSDVEAYLCGSCASAKLSIARQIDAKVGSTVGQQPSGELHAYDAARAAKGMRYANARDMGITF